MKKYLLILFTVFSAAVFAQDAPPIDEPPMPKDKQMGEAVEALKIAFITKELGLTSEEAQKFWPVYNEYVAEIKTAKETAKQDVVVFEEKKVVILKKYKDNFKKILGTDERVNKCFNAGPRFHQMLKREWIRRHQMHKNGDGGPSKPPKEGDGERRKYEGGGKPLKQNGGGAPQHPNGGGTPPHPRPNTPNTPNHRG